MDRKHLAMALSRIRDPPHPESRLEQVRTPGNLAADFLLHAYVHGDIAGRRVVDLGAGTGVLGIGALLLGARRVAAYEIEPALVEIARESAAQGGTQDAYRAAAADIATLEPTRVTEDLGASCDTVVMNPPFGADRHSRAAGGDRVFLSLAFRLAPVVYSMHLKQTEAFLQAYALDAGYRHEILQTVAFPLPARFAHHKRERSATDVAFVRFQRA